MRPTKDSSSAAISMVRHTSRAVPCWTNPTQKVSNRFALRPITSHSHSESRPFIFPTTPSPTPFEIFHLPPSATTSQVKERYYQLVKIYHPDVASTSAQKQGAEIARKFKLIRDAYELLSSPPKKERYIRFREGWQNSRPTTPNRSWANSSTGWKNQSGYSHSPHYAFSSIWSKISHAANGSARNGFYSSSDSRDDWNNYYHPRHHDHSQDSSTYTFRQQWERDGLFTKNGIFITSVGCVSLFLYLVQLWRVLPLVRSDNQFDGHPQTSDREKIKFRKFIEPEGDERLDQEAWSKIRPIQFTKLDSNGGYDSGPSRAPLVISSLTRTAPIRSSSTPNLENPQKLHRRLVPSSFQDRIQRQNLKSISDLKFARAAAVKPSVLSRRLSQSPNSSPSLDSSSAPSHSA